MYLFSNPGFISLNDPYRPSDRKKKEVFSTPFRPTNPSKKGKLYPSTFTRLNYVSSKYVSPSRLDQIYNKKRREKMNRMKKITEPFRYTSPPKKSEGSGSIYGTIGPPIEYVSRGKSQKTKRRERHDQGEPRNFYTSPGKKGGYGYCGTTFRNSNELFDNKPNPYVTVREWNIQRNKKEREKFGDKEPFRGVSCARGCFDFQRCVDASKIYTPPPGGKNERNAKNVKKKTKFEAESPFRPAGRSKKPFGVFSMFEATREPFEVKKAKKKSPISDREHFRPTGRSKSGPTKSVVFGLKEVFKFFKMQKASTDGT